MMISSPRFAASRWLCSKVEKGDIHKCRHHIGTASIADHWIQNNRWSAGIPWRAKLLYAHGMLDGGSPRRLIGGGSGILVVTDSDKKKSTHELVKLANQSDPFVANLDRMPGITINWVVHSHDPKLNGTRGTQHPPEKKHGFSLRPLLDRLAAALSRSKSE